MKYVTGKIIASVILILIGYVLFTNGIFDIGPLILFILVLLVIIWRIEDIKKFYANFTTGEIGIELHISEEQIKQDIIDNNQSVTPEIIEHFKTTEEKVLNDVFKRMGGEMKKKIHFVHTDSPKEVYTPDATVKKDNNLYFLEVKYVSNPSSLNKIVKNAVNQLSNRLKKFSASSGVDLKLIGKIILASSEKFNVEKFDLPSNIELEIYNLPKG